MNKLHIGIIATAVAALVGCGGGGTDTAATAATAVSGTAAKGLVKQAKVLVCRIVNGVPEADASCTTTTTANDGSYSVTFSDGFTGPAMIKIMAGAASTMVDETTGTDIPYNMTMRAVIPAVSGATTAHVTPFSEIAANAASMTTMNATTISQSIAAAQGVMAGLDINLGVMPLMNLKDNGADIALLTKQFNMVKQLSRVAMAARYSSLLTDAGGVSCNAAGTATSQHISCAVTAMAGVMNGYATSDPTKTAAMLAALNAQDVTGATIPIMKADGTVSMQLVDMTSSTSMQAALQRAGMETTSAASAANVMMRGMR